MQGDEPGQSRSLVGAPVTVAPDPATTAKRHGVRAALVQLASPFVYSGTLLAGLVWEIPLGPTTSGSYLQIFAFLGSLVLLLVAVAIAGTAALMLQRGGRWGGFLLAGAAGLACLESVGLAVGAPTGIAELEPVRVVTIVVGVVWFAVSVVCLVVGVRAFRALSPAPPLTDLVTPPG